MKINRDNYEMYFLMYVDNELSAAERNDVETFVSENHDLKDELELLKGTTLPSEEMIFVPKTLLYKNATEVESVQQSLLLHLHNELSAADAATVQSQIASNTQVEAEWNILQKTKLDAKDRIVFNDKRSLYRHTDNVISISFPRAAVAAILIGAGIFVGVSLYNNSSEDRPQATDDRSAEEVPVQRSSDNRPQTTDDRSAAEALVQRSSEDRPQTTDNRSAEEVLVQRSSEDRPQTTDDRSNQTARQNVKDKEGGLDIDKIKEVQRIVAADDIAVVTPLSKIKEITRPVIDTDISEVKESFARLAVNEETGSNNRILYMDEDKITRSKLGGLFRKVRRVVERNTKIKTSNGLRIGGFEFAVK